MNARARITRYAADSRLIFDLGMNNGDDSLYYLQRGFNVVAIEANPVLCERATERLRPALDDGRLTIVNAAIWQKTGEATFYVNLNNDHWSSLEVGWAGRDASRYRKITARSVTLSDLFEKFGVPHYLKIDVEGADHSVLAQLQGSELLPLYVSVEDCRFGLQYMEMLADCGYDGFKLVDQSTIGHMINPATSEPFAAGSSGPFGADLPGEWLTHDDMVKFYSATVRDPAGNRLAPRSHWWDIHCTRRQTSGKQ